MPVLVVEGSTPSSEFLGAPLALVNLGQVIIDMTSSPDPEDVEGLVVMSTPSPRACLAYLDANIFLHIKHIQPLVEGQY